MSVPFRDACLVVAINESSRAERVSVGRPGSAARVVIDVPTARSSLTMVDVKTWTA